MKRYTGKGHLKIRDKKNANNVVAAYVPGEVVADVHVKMLSEKQQEGLADVKEADAKEADAKKSDKK